MKTKLTWIDRIMAAVTFAEANEHVKAKELLNGSERTTANRRECDCLVAADLNGAEVNS